MDTDRFWQLVELARRQVAAPADADGAAAEATALLAARSPQEILRAQQILWDLMADSYRAPLWAAAYLINGGCSDDGFDYFRGWLVAQGRDAFERAVADPDTPVDHPTVRAAAEGGNELEAEDFLAFPCNAYRQATGRELPRDSFTINYPDLDPAWNFSFDDHVKVAPRLPRLDALYTA
ncbi:DUF4240 domain-containing protein [Streptomyces sp. NRRL F-5123]|uniref:DUF4240 domain-containing protein n=1 Tax=Streptomyces sp. NRRL F-5123 TaxID=1463856 RepID=UPI0004E1CDA6|nr:DUF4240 domain-containing protein [Streptomyces sp. NRRL F-5123]